MVKTCKICERKLVLNPSVNDNQGFLNFFKNIFSSNNNNANSNNLQSNDQENIVVEQTSKLGVLVQTKILEEKVKKNLFICF